MYPLSLFLLILTPLAFAAPNRWCLPINPTFNNVNHPDSDPNCKGGSLDRAQHGPVCHCEYLVKLRNSKGCPIQYYSKCSPILINRIAILRDQPLAVPPQSYLNGIRKPTPYGSTNIGYGPASRTRTEFPTKVGINCLEARDIILAAVIKGVADYPVPSCTKNDKYERQQCTSGVAPECWCVVPETGEELSDSRGLHSSVNCNGGIDKKPPNPTVQYAEFGAITKKPDQPSLTTAQAHKEVTAGLTKDEHTTPLVEPVIPETTITLKPEAPDDSTEPIPSDLDTTETPVETVEAEQTTTKGDPLDAGTTKIPEDLETEKAELTTGQVEPEIPEATITAKPEVPEKATEPIPSDAGTTEAVEDATEPPVETGEAEQTTTKGDPLDAGTTPVDAGEAEQTTTPWDPLDVATTPVDTGEAEQTTTPWDPLDVDTTPVDTGEAEQTTTPWDPLDVDTTPVDTGEAEQTTTPWDPLDVDTTPVDTGEAEQTTTPWDPLDVGTTTETFEDTV